MQSDLVDSKLKRLAKNFELSKDNKNDRDRETVRGMYL